MKERPTSVTVIAWFLIVMGVISIISSIISLFNPNPMVEEIMSRNPLPVPIQQLLSYVGIAVSIVSGMYMLDGANWARFLYVIWSVIGILISIITLPNLIFIIPGLVLLVIITFYLFRPKANDYFNWHF